MWVIIFLSAGNKLFNPSWCNELIHISKDSSCGLGKDVSVFQKGKITGLYSSRENIMDTADNTKIGLIAQRIKIGRIVGILHLPKRNVARKNY